MQKTFLIAAGLLTGSLLLTGCQPKKSTMTIEPGVQSEQQVASEAQRIARAIDSGEALKCTMTDKVTGESFQYSVKGEKFRAEGMTMEEDGVTKTGAVISDGSFYYYWTQPDNQGFKMTIPEPGDTPAEAPAQDVPDFSDPEDQAEYEKTHTITCETGGFGDEAFTPPAEVTFQDLSMMMQQSLDDASQGMTPEQQQQLQDAMENAGY